MNQSVVYLNHEVMPTALDVVESLIKKRGADVKAGRVDRSYVVREFQEEKSVDISGKTVKSPEMIIHTRDVDGAIDNVDTRSVLAMQIEKSLGVPHLPPVNVDNIKARPIKTPAEIGPRLDKLRKKAASEIKALREIGVTEIEEAQNPATLGGLEGLTWLYNGGSGRDFPTIMRHLFKRILAREREKLFHIRQHPNQAPLHICHNEQILEEIKMLEWAIGGNPFDEVAKATYGTYHGASRF
jgi:hypothetical protein